MNLVSSLYHLLKLRFVIRSTILESKPELLETVVKKSHHINGKVYYVNHYSISVVKKETFYSLLSQLRFKIVELVFTLKYFRQRAFGT